MELRSVSVSLDVDEIVTRCRQALMEHTPPLAVRDVLAELVREPAALEAALDPVDEGGIRTLHRAPDLTVLRIAWTPGISLNPHNHAMWAVVGLYGGQEDNVFYRRSPGGLEGAGGRELRRGDVLAMGVDAIHAVANPRREFAVALHVYGGDFFEGNRSEWDAVNFEERPRDLDGTRRLFTEANAAWRAEADRH
jgi:predicted metal-dependent enzyme (double-stranded beta helix superfamily)